MAETVGGTMESSVINAASGQGRRPYFDNARYLLMFLVVIGHFIDLPSLMEPGAPSRAVLFWIYFLHMPGMALISGFFAKGEPLSRVPGRLAVRLLAPYVVFQLAYAIALGKPLGFHEPYYLMWYSMSLFSWHVLLPLAKRLWNPLVWAVAVGLLAGYVPQIGSTLSLSRTLAFFPFFLAGYCLEERHFVWLAGRRREAVVSLSILGVVAWGLSGANPLWMNFADSYAVLGVPHWWAASIRFAQYVAAAIGCAAFFALVPSRTVWFSAMGTRTMYVYLWHGLILIVGRRVGLESFGLWAVVGAGCVTTLLLGSALVQRLTRWVVEPLWLLPSPPSQCAPT